MSNAFLNGMTNATNYTRTENGAITHKTTKSALLDMFALGGAMRKRSEEDIILMFRNAFAENPTYALKCLFYLRDVRGGQGERRFFRTCIKDLAKQNPEALRRNIENIPEYGRWDDLYTLVGTPCEEDAFALIKSQLVLDVQSKTPSLLAKWLKSENTSSAESRYLASRTRKYLGWNSKQYRKTLSALRARINVLERLMSAGRWDEIEFDKIPSRAGIIYRNAFARRDILKAKYESFVKDENTKVNAEVLNPVDIAERILGRNCYGGTIYLSEVERTALQKYWDNLKDYYNGREEPGIAIVDVSGSMYGTPLHAAVSMGAYIAERGKGPFANHFITFSGNPELVKFEGVDIADKFTRAIRADWGMNTNIEAVFDLMLKVAINDHVPAEDMPQTLYIFSDMQFDGAITSGHVSHNRWDYYRGDRVYGEAGVNTLLESIAQKWASYGYELPRVIFWNLDARQNDIPALGGRFSYVSGFSMNMIEQILSGEDGYSLMMKKLDSDRYKVVQ